MLSPIDEWEVDEAGKVEAWREHVLLEAGYPPSLARELAGDSSVDLHQAVELVASGCPPETAARILR